MVGLKISHYQMVAKLGEGAMGIVYKAEDLKLKRTVALKCLNLKSLSEPQMKARFLREAQTAAAIDHPNVCTIYEIDEADGQTFIAMAYIDGPTLSQKLRHGPLSLDEAVDLATQIAWGLQEAHEKGVVHRDIKSANIILTSKGQAKVTDFGLAHLTGQTHLTEEGTTLGTPSYMSPEQAMGIATDHQTDIWSLGVVFYEMVIGSLPFEGEFDRAVMYSIINEDPAPLTSRRAGVPIEFDRIVEKALAKRPEERYQRIDDMLVDLRRARKIVDAGSTKPSARRAMPSDVTRIPTGERSRRLGLNKALVALAALAATSVLTLWIARTMNSTGQQPAQPKLTRLTTNPGLSYQPAMSLDGQLLAYASDRGSGGNLDIWVQQVNGANSIRLTSDPADDYEPHFSPDGTRVVFHADREGGGIYVVPTLGGNARLIAPRGRRPRFSPDGNLIAYWTGEEHLQECQTYVVNTAGGNPRQLAADFYMARYPTWAKDGKHLLFEGIRSRESRSETQDWWVVSVEDGTLIKTGAYESFEAADLEVLPQLDFRLVSPGAFDAKGTNVLFAGASGDISNLWTAPVSTTTWKVTGAPRRLTTGSGLERFPTAGPEGQVVFSSLRANTDIWSLPIDANHGRAQGEMSRLTDSPGNDFGGFLTADGQHMVYNSIRSGKGDLWLLDVATGKKMNLTESTASERSGIISADGAYVAYTVIDTEVRPIWVVPTKGGMPHKVCDDCGNPTHWSPDGKDLLYETRDTPTRIALINIASRESRDVLTNPTFGIFDSRFSADGSWISFHAAVEPDRRRLFVAPFDPGGVTAGDDQWIPITAGSSLEGFSWWSPNGEFLYYLSDHDGFVCIWAQRLAADGKKPVGPAEPIRHFHDRKLSFAGMIPSLLKVSVAPDRIVFSLREISGDVWLAVMPPE